MFRRRVCKGPPPEYRWAAWKVISGALQSEVKGAYDELIEQASQFSESEHPVLNQINLDLNRTYPWHPFFATDKYGYIGQPILKRALKAYAMYNTEVGYTQSINFVMGFFLILNGGSDEEAFWQFTAISKRNHNYGNVENFDGGLSEFYCDNFPLYCQFVYQFDKLFERKLPKLKEHFDELGFYTDLYLQNWFMTIFNTFPMNLCIRIWDYLLVEGLIYMFKFPLAIMELLQNQLLENDLEGVNDIIMGLRNIDFKAPDCPLPTIEEIMDKTKNVKVTKEELLTLKKEYDANVDSKKPMKEIKRLPTLFDDKEVKNKQASEDKKFEDLINSEQSSPKAVSVKSQSRQSHLENAPKHSRLTIGTKNTKKVDTKKLMKLVSANTKVNDNSKEFGDKLKESSKHKEKGRISMPEENELKVNNQITNENLLKMPFSLNDIEDEEVNSPFHRNVSDKNEMSHTPSLEIQMEQVDDDLYEVDENIVFEGFDEMTEVKQHNKSNHMLDSSNLYLDLSNKLVSCRDENCQADSKYSKNKSFNYPLTAEKTGHNTISNNHKGTSKNVITDNEIDFTANSNNLRGKSFTTRKPNMYSDFDEHSDNESFGTEVRPSMANTHSKINNIKPGVIKGFCSSVSSDEDGANEGKNRSPEQNAIFKHDFYKSGDAFYQNDQMTPRTFNEPVKPTSSNSNQKSQKNMDLGFKFSIDSDN